MKAAIYYVEYGDSFSRWNKTQMWNEDKFYTMLDGMERDGSITIYRYGVRMVNV